MATPTSMFAGYAYYGTNADGFVYTLTKISASTNLTSPSVVVSGVTKATNFFQFLFLVAGGALMLVLLFILSVTFCCRRRVASLEEKYWRLHHAYAEVNDALVHEIAHRTPVPPPAKPQPQMQRRSSANSLRSRQYPPKQQQQQQQQQQRQPQMQRYASTHSARLPQQQMMQQQQQLMIPSNTYQCKSNQWTLTSEAVGVYPPRQPPSQPLFPTSPVAPVAVSSSIYDYNNMYTTNPVFAAPLLPQPQTPPPPQHPIMTPQPILSPSTPQPQMDGTATSPSASQEGLRHRESKVRFL